MLSSTVKQALRTAAVISIVKTVALILNALVSLALVLGGVLSIPSGVTPTIREDGFVYSSGPSDGLSFWWVFTLQGVALLIFGSLTIYVLLGWFEHMLRTNTELVRQAELNNAGRSL